MKASFDTPYSLPPLTPNSLIVSSDFKAPVPSCINGSDANFIEECETPTYWHGLLASLADNTSQFDTLEGPVYLPLKEPHKHLARIATLNFLNNHYAPVCSTREDHNFNSPEDITIRRLDTCSYAEKSLLDTFYAMNGLRSGRDPEYLNTMHWTIIADATNQPIAIKKYAGERSAMSFVPLTIDGYSYPAGSLFRMSLHNEPVSPATVRVKRSVTPYTNIKLIKFLRLSAFAHEPLERKQLFKKRTPKTHTPTCISMKSQPSRGNT